MNKSEINERISRSRESLRDWNNLKDQSPSKAHYCDMQIKYELERFENLQSQLLKRVTLESSARFCRHGFHPSDSLDEFSDDQLRAIINN